VKNTIGVGLAILVVVIGGVMFWYMSSSSGQTSGGPGDYQSLQAATPQPLNITGIGGYNLSSIDLGDGSVPLVRIPLDTWGGYAALFAANGGTAPNKESVFYKDHKFAVEIVSEEETQAQLDGFAAGRYPFIWASMDSLPLLYDALKSDRRVVPQAIALFDWSVGGDGIIVRDFIRRPQDLKGKTILTSMATPYSFFMLWYLAQLDINPLDVKVVHEDDAPAALQVFKDNPSIAAWVTWTPFLTDVPDPTSPDHIPGTRLLITSKDANQLIADVIITRNDLVREKPEIVNGIVDGLLKGEEILMSNGAVAFQAMAAFYKLEGGASEAREMISEVHLPNYPENRMFFDPENSIGAHKIFYLAQEYYKLLGILPSGTSFEAERVIALTGLDVAQSSGRYARQTNRVVNSFNREAGLDINDLENQRVVLSNDIKLYFEAQKLDFDVNQNSEEIRQNMRLLERVREQMTVLGTTIVKLIGHLDTSRVEDFRAQGPQAFVEASAQAKLISKRRAEFVKKILIENLGVEQERIITEGRGWDQPIDPLDPSANRRVEVQFLSFE